MRLLHTSDWHLGQHFMGKSRQAEHRMLIDWLLDEVAAQMVDAVIVAGDIFDTGTPPSHARELLAELVVRLHDAGVALLLLAGNHDSPATLNENRRLFARLGATVITGVADDPAAQAIVLGQRDGTPGCVVCAVPFVRPREVLRSRAGESAEDKQQALQQAIAAHYLAVDAAARAKSAGLPVIATGHLSTVGASASESVREIYVGTLDAFPTNAFPPADYIALGHIHRPQKVGGHEHIRYSGSPLALSFDEAAQGKEMLLVDLDAGGLQAVTPLPVPCFQPMAAVRGRLADLPALIGTAAAPGSAATPVWLEVTVVGDDWQADLPARIDEIAAGLPVEILRIRRQREQAAASLAGESGETLAELTPDEVFARRLAQESIDDELRAALIARHREVLASLAADGA